MLDTEITPLTMTLDAIPKSRGITEQELIAKYEKLCKRHNVMPLWGQIRTALKTLAGDGRIKFVDSPNGKLVRKV